MVTTARTITAVVTNPASANPMCTSVLAAIRPVKVCSRAHVMNPLQNAMHRAYKCALWLLESEVVVSSGVVVAPSHYFW